MISNEIGENIYENVAEAIEKKEQFDGTYEEFKTGFTQKKEKLAENVENRYQKFIVFLKIACEKAPEALEYTVGRFIPEEVEAKDFYQYVLTHSDIFTHFNPDSSAPVKPM